MDLFNKLKKKVLSSSGPAAPPPSQAQPKEVPAAEGAGTATAPAADTSQAAGNAAAPQQPSAPEPPKYFIDFESKKNIQTLTDESLAQVIDLQNGVVLKLGRSQACVRSQLPPLVEVGRASASQRLHAKGTIADCNFAISAVEQVTKENCFGSAARRTEAHIAAILETLSQQSQQQQEEEAEGAGAGNDQTEENFDDTPLGEAGAPAKAPPASVPRLRLGGPNDRGEELHEHDEEKDAAAHAMHAAQLAPKKPPPPVVHTPRWEEAAEEPANAALMAGPFSARDHSQQAQQQEEEQNENEQDGVNHQLQDKQVLQEVEVAETTQHDTSTTEEERHQSRDNAIDRAGEQERVPPDDGGNRSSSHCISSASCGEANSTTDAASKQSPEAPAEAVVEAISERRPPKPEPTTDEPPPPDVAATGHDTQETEESPPADEQTAAPNDVKRNKKKKKGGKK